MQFSAVPARKTKEFRATLVQGRKWAAPSTNGPRYGITPSKTDKSDAFFTQGTLQRTRAIQAYLQRGAAVVCAEYDRTPVSFTLAEYKHRDTHIQLVRLVVFPKKG